MIGILCLFFGLSIADIYSSLRISEVMVYPQSNKPTEDPHYSASDFAFVEFINTDPSQFLDISKVEISGAISFKFPSGLLEPGGRVVVASSEKALTNRYTTFPPDCILGSYKHKLDQSDTIEVKDSSGVLIQNFTYQDWYPDVLEQGYSLNAVNPQGYQSTSWNQQESWYIGVLDGTPCSEDSVGTGAVSFSNPNVFINAGDTSTLTPTANIQSVTILYTTDLSAPTTSSPSGNPVLVTPGNYYQVRARVKNGNNLGPVFTKTYIVTDPSLTQFQVMDLPIVIFTSFGQDNYEKDIPPAISSIIIVDQNLANGQISNSAVVFDGPAYTNIRGSSSSNFDKKPWSVKFINGDDNHQKRTPFGLPKSRKFVLNDPWVTDNIFVRNPLFFSTYTNLTNRWSPRTVHCELFFANDDKPLSNSHYWGIYIFMESVEIDSDRVDIKSMTPLDNYNSSLTGGYLIKIDRGDPDAGGDDIFTGGPQDFVYSDPEYTDITSEQKQYLIDWWNNFYSVLTNINPSQVEPDYMKLLDVTTSIDQHIWQIFSGNIDAFKLSTYLVKDQDGPFYWGPLWDLDRTVGCISLDPWGCYAATSFPNYFFTTPFWTNFWKDNQFIRRYSNRWAYLRQNGFNITYFNTTVYNYVSVLSPCADRNYDRWTSSRPTAGYLGTVQQFMTWLSQRMQLMDSRMCYGVTPPCKDNSYCTDDVCSLKDSTCLNVPNECPFPECALVSNDGDPCNDSNVCTTGDHCLEGDCVGSGSLDCSDGVYCTDDYCDPILGCIHEVNDDKCVTNETCTVSSCDLQLDCKYVCIVPPTPTPTSIPTSTPTSVPTTAPTSVPTTAPTSVPTSIPTSKPTPTSNPSSTTPSTSPSSPPQISPSLTPAFSPNSTDPDFNISSSINDNSKGLDDMMIGIIIGIIMTVLIVVVIVVIVIVKKNSQEVV